MTGAPRVASIRRLASVALMSVVLVIGVSAAARGTSTPVVTKVVLTTADSGATRTYVARVMDDSGKALTGAALDIGGLEADPDQRVRTVPMKASVADPTRYAARVTFPVDGNWVLVIRVHTPSQYVHLASEAITTGRDPVPSHDLASNPARRAVLAANPNFYKTYDPLSGIGSNGASGSRSATIASSVTGSHSTVTAQGATVVQQGSFEISALIIAVLHLIGAISWLGATALLALGGRLGRGFAQRELVRQVASRYALLAGGGLALVVFTGVGNLQLATPTGFDLAALTDTALGTAYVLILAAKLGLAAASLVLALRIGQGLAVDRPRGFSVLEARSLGAAAAPAATDRALRLAEFNAAVGGLILIAGIVLTQLNHALH